MEINKVLQIPTLPCEADSFYFVKNPDNKVDCYVSDDAGNQLFEVFNSENLPSVEGPSEVLIDSSEYYTITDYDFLTNYTISAEGGTVVRNNDSILFTAQSTPVEGHININGKIIPVSVKYSNTAPIIYERGFITVSEDNNDLLNQHLYATHILPNNKLLVLTHSRYNGDLYKNVLSKINEDGSIDTTFGVNGSVLINEDTAEYSFSLIFQDSLSNIYIILNDGVEDLKIVKVSNAGVLDQLYGVVTINRPTNENSTSTIHVRESVKLNDGSIYLSLYYYDAALDVSATYILKINPDSSVDTTFGVNGYYQSYIYSICKTNDNKLLVLNVDELLMNFYINKIDSTGQIDTAYGDNGSIVLPSEINGNTGMFYFSIKEKPNGGVLILGLSPSYYNTIIIQYNSDGTLSDGFANNGILSIENEFTHIVYPMSDNKILSVSSKIFNSNIVEHNVKLINNDGTLVSTFGTNGVFSYKERLLIMEPEMASTGILLDDNNRILIATNTVVGEYTRMFISRLNSNGTQDITFGSNIDSGLEEDIVCDINTNIVLFPNIDVIDSQLSVLNNGIGNFNGCSVSVTRYNIYDISSSQQDEFSVMNNVVFENNEVTVDNLVIGNYTNENGLLTINFTTSDATNARVNSLLRNISYRVTEILEPDSWYIKLLFNDGNTGSQGIGDNMTTLYSVTLTPNYGHTLTTYCQGVNKEALLTDGRGGTVNITIETNSVDCGYDPYVYPTSNNIPQPTVWVNTSETEGVVLSNQGKSVAGIPINTILKADAVITSGKWYWEISTTANNLLEYISPIIGVSTVSASLNLTPPFINKWLYDDENGLIRQSTTTYTLEFYNLLNSDTYVFGIALDMNTGTLRIYNDTGNIIAVCSGIDTNKAVSPTIGNSTLSQLGLVTANFGITPFANSLPFGYRGLNDILFVHDSFTETSKVNLLAHQTNTGQSWVKGTTALDVFTNLDLNIEVNTDGSTSVEEYDHYDELGVTEAYSSANNKLSDAWLNYLIPSHNYYIEALVEVLPDANDSYFTIYARIQNLIDDGDYVDLNWWPSPSWTSGRSTINESNWGSGINNPTPIDVGEAYPPGQYLIKLVLEYNMCQLYIDNVYKYTLSLTGPVITNTSNGGYCGFGIFPKTTNLNGQGIKLLDYKVYNKYIEVE
jgi:uncharacterized delta-60 repeat protein